MSSTAEALFLAAMNATLQTILSDANPIVSISNALSSLSLEFDIREQWLLEQLRNEPWDDTTKFAPRVRQLLRKASLHVRYFIEERDRYPNAGVVNFRNIYEINPSTTRMNFCKERHRIPLALSINSVILPGPPVSKVTVS